MISNAPFRAVKILILLGLFQQCSYPKYNGEPSLFYNTIDKEFDGEKEGFWYRYLDSNFKPTKNEETAFFKELVYYRNDERLISDIKLPKKLRSEQILHLNQPAKNQKPKILEGTYRFLQNDLETIFVDLSFENGILYKYDYFFNNEISNTTFIIYNHPEYGSISYTINYDIKAPSYWITKIYDYKHIDLIDRSDKPLLTQLEIASNNFDSISN